MSDKTEQESLSGWRKEFATLHRLFRSIPAEFLEKATVLLILLLILILPLEMLVQTFSRGSIYNRAYGVLGACIQITAFIWLGKRILVPECCDRPQWTLCDMALLAMLGWSVLSTLAAPDPLVCFRGDVYRREGLTTYFLYACVYLLTRSCCRRENSRRILTCFVMSLSAVGVLSSLCLSPLADFLSGLLGKLPMDITRLGICGPFANRNHFSYMLGVAIVLAGGLSVTDSGRKMQTLYMIVYALLIHVAILNQSLGGYIASAIGLAAYLVVACLRKDLQIHKAIFLMAVFAVVSGLSSGSSGSLATDLTEAIESVQGPEAGPSSLRDRLDMWKETLSYIAQRPLFGYGPEGSGVVSFWISGVKNDRPHNEYLQYAVFLGIPGLVMYLTALGSLLVRLLRRFHKHSPMCVVIACTVLAYCASAFVGNSMYYTTIYYIIILAMLVNESAHAYPETQK